MAHMGRPKYNPFLDDDNEDVDDFIFLAHPKQGSSGYMLEDGMRDDNNVDLKRQQLLDERRKIQERTIQSTQSSLGLIHESEQIGIATAEELDKQGEKLHNIERKVDDINSTMRISQKHLTSMKSLFGSIKNYFSGTGVQTRVDEPEDKKPSALMSKVTKIKEDGATSNSSSHPGLRVRGLDTSGFSEAVDEVQFAGATPTVRQSADTVYSIKAQEYEENFNKNLSMFAQPRTIGCTH
ncbi:synaptosomal-associated protein 29-like [Limulus polyphemus]|uniref:Synaptosomal-associated protein 29-like n=1 Tax=Limulus polyphemus TaxID=6850 RepID=A0ABM1TM92_LIMPO|nr:synaptosomal-associated protein 29-like [Limulus polyphemus]